MKAILSFAAIAAALLTAAPAEAGRFCGDRVESGRPSAATEALAKEAAQSWWSSRAGALGAATRTGRSREDKTMKCQTNAITGSVTCMASAKPCLPEGVLPDTAPKTDL